MSAIGYDLGNHSSFVALVRTGGIDTVDNEYSYRATPSVISFSNCMRLVGNAAKSRIIVDHRNTVTMFKNLIALDYDSAIAQYEMSVNPFKFMRMSDNKIGISVQYNNNTQIFSIFQLVSALASDLRHTTLRHIKTVSACVIAVPNWFDCVQREAMVCAWNVAGFTNVKIINETCAVCLNYILFKTDINATQITTKNDTHTQNNETNTTNSNININKNICNNDINDNNKNIYNYNNIGRIVVFIDIGYSNTQISITHFINHNKFKILSNIGTNTIGGRCFDLVLYNKFSNEFNNKYNLDVNSNIKSKLKLLTECETLKRQLNSTSTELPIKIECFLNDIDFFSKTNRDEFDKLSVDLFEKFKNLCLEALNTAGINVSDIFSVEAVGGSSRLLGLRRIMAEVFKKDVSNSLNADEAVSRGCAIKCALDSPVVKIREIEIKDLIYLDFTAEYLTRSNEIKQIKIYGKSSVIPAKKELVFAAVDKFSFKIFQTDISGCRHLICECSIDSSDIFEKYGELVEKLVFYCNVDTSNIFSVVKAFYIVNDSNDSGKKINIDIKFDVNYSYQFKNQVEGCRKIEEQILKQIEVEKLRAAAKNSLEEFIYSSRDQSETVLKDFITDNEFSGYLESLGTEEEWLYDEGENQTAEIYQSRLMELQKIFFPFKARRDAFENGRIAVDNLFKVLMHYRKFLDTFGANQAKYSHISIDEVNEYSHRIGNTETYAFQMDNALKNTPKFKLPPVSSVEVEQKSSELRFWCDQFLKKAENPPQQPPQQPAAQQQSEATENLEASQGPSQGSN